MKRKRLIRDDGRYVLLYSFSHAHTPSLPQRELLSPCREAARKPPTCRENMTRSSKGDEKSV
jgi:hypothetical protein